MSAAVFTMIPPLAVTDAVLTLTNVPESVVPTYVGGTTYDEGDRAGPAPVYGSPQLVWESLQNGNMGNAQVAGVWWKYVGIVYPVYDAGQTCALGGIVTDLANHVLYESLVAANGEALSDATKWLNIGSTNARAAFDSVYGSQTANGDTIVFELAPGVVVNNLFLGNIDGASIAIEQSGSGWSYTETLTSHPVLNWYDFYYSLPIRKTDVPITGIPPNPTGVLTVTIDNTGGTAKLGLCVVGKGVAIGTTQWEVIGGFLSYSGTTTDTFGNTKFLPRPGAKKLNLDVQIPPGFETEAHRLLALYTDTPMVFIGASQYGMTTAYGYLKSWQVPVSNSGKTAPIEIYGLI